MDPPAFEKYSIHWVLVLSLSVCVCLCLCICLFVSLCLGHCHRQMTSFQKIYGLYGLGHHIVEMNGDATMRDQQQPTEDSGTH